MSQLKFQGGEVDVHRAPQTEFFQARSGKLYYTNTRQVAAMSPISWGRSAQSSGDSLLGIDSIFLIVHLFAGDRQSSCVGWYPLA